MDRRTQEDGTIVVGGQIVPVGGSIPTVASVVSYSGNTGLQSTNVEGALDELDNEKAPLTHDHDNRYFTEVEVTSLLAGKAAAVHTHDDRYFTEVEVTNLLAGKSDTGHIHDDRYYTETEVDVKIANALATTELHENPSFDLVVMTTDGPGETTVPARLHPEAWSNFWNNGSGADRVLIESDNVVTHTPGGYSVRVDHPGPTSGLSLSTPPFGVAPGAVVTVSAWVRGTGPRVLLSSFTGPPGSNPDFFGSNVTQTDTTSSVPTTEWSQISMTFVVPAGHTRCSFKLRSSSDGASGSTPGAIWWDDSKSSMQVVPNPVTNSHLGEPNRLGPSSLTTGMMDYNLVRDSGYYVMDSGAANRPSFNATCYLEVRAYSTTYIEQVARHVIDGRKATRRMTAGSWGAWVEDVTDLVPSSLANWNASGSRINRRGNSVTLVINATATAAVGGGSPVLSIPAQHRPVPQINNFYFAVVDSASGSLTSAFISADGSYFAHVFSRSSGQGTLGSFTYTAQGN